MEGVSNPKRWATKARCDLYNYYAGYSPHFVQDVLNLYAVNDKTIVLDPWNGSGTTTRIASRNGCEAIGYDINPVMAIVALAHEIGINNLPSIPALWNNILEKRDEGVVRLPDDPLLTWMDESSCLLVRGLEQGIQKQLISNHMYSPIIERGVSEISGIAAFFYLALFNTMRIELSMFGTTNPTWTKIPKDKEKVSLEECSFIRSMEDELDSLMVKYKNLDTSKEGVRKGKTHLDVAESSNLPLPDDHVDLVISSPPYCTRLDYAMSTCIELTLLGYSPSSSLKDLRRAMIGSPVIKKGMHYANQKLWGKSCNEFLNAVSLHKSKAARSYYHKTLAQYYDSIYCSLGEISRVLKKGGSCILVVQDSYFKDVHNDVPKIVEEMCMVHHMNLVNKYEYQCSLNYVNINKRARAYRKGHATESVLIVKKGVDS